jgi:hypothetical protein
LKNLNPQLLRKWEPTLKSGAIVYYCKTLLFNTMNNICVRLVALLMILDLQSIGQETLPVPRNIQSLYKEGTRSPNGKPGPNYWQNTADYTIRVNFNPVTLLVNGSASITYTNNSPDTLFEIVFKIYPNLYQKGSQRLSKVSPEDVNEGMQIDKFSITNSPVLTYSFNGTNMTVTIPPLLPKQKIVLDIAYHYTLNKGSHNRTGQVEPNSAFVAYFFPRIAVYDDIDGWNKNQYLRHTGVL